MSLISRGKSKKDVGIGGRWSRALGMMLRIRGYRGRDEP